MIFLFYFHQETINTMHNRSKDVKILEANEIDKKKKGTCISTKDIYAEVCLREFQSKLEKKSKCVCNKFISNKTQTDRSIMCCNKTTFNNKVKHIFIFILFIITFSS